MTTGTERVSNLYKERKSSYPGDQQRVWHTVNTQQMLIREMRRYSRVPKDSETRGTKLRCREGLRVQGFRS